MFGENRLALEIWDERKELKRELESLRKNYKELEFLYKEKVSLIIVLEEENKKLEDIIKGLREVKAKVPKPIKKRKPNTKANVSLPVLREEILAVRNEHLQESWQVTFEEIGEKYGKTPGWARQQAQKMGIIKKTQSRPRLSEKTKQSILEGWANSETAFEIATKNNVSITTVNRLIKKFKEGADV